MYVQNDSKGFFGDHYYDVPISNFPGPNGCSVAGLLSMHILCIVTTRRSNLVGANLTMHSRDFFYRKLESLWFVVFFLRTILE